MKISVIIPVYNAETYLNKCVESILGQTYRDFELLLIEDGSKDSSPIICDNYANIDSRVKVFHKKNEGVSRARNYGLENAEGDWIWFVDSDDYAELDALQRFVDILSQYPNIDIYKFGFAMERRTGCHIVKASSPKLLYSTSLMALELESNKYTGFLWNMIFHRSLLDETKFNVEISYCEDHLFSYTVIAKSRMMFVDTKLSYHYVVREDGCNLSNMHLHSALSIVKSAILNRKARMNCIEQAADKGAVTSLLQKIDHSYRSQLYVAYEVLYNHAFKYKESKEVFGLINKKLPTICAWLYYNLRYRIHKYRFERSQR